MSNGNETPHIAAIRKQWMLKKLAAERKHIPFSPAHDLETTLAIARAAEAGTIVKTEPAQTNTENGVLIGTWQPEGLSQTFNVYAAPEDLRDEASQQAIFKYVDAVKRIAALTNWHGYRGTNYEDDLDLYKALKDGSYIKEGSGWFIPPRQLQTGMAWDKPTGSHAKGAVSEPANLYDHKDTGALSGSFRTAVSSGNDYPGWYWSSTSIRDLPSYKLSADFSNGDESCYPKDHLIRLSCRPIRLELQS